MEGRAPTATFPDVDDDFVENLERQQGEVHDYDENKGGSGGGSRFKIMRLKGGGLFDDSDDDGPVLFACCCCGAILIIVLVFAIIIFGSWHHLDVPDIALARSAIDPVLELRSIPGPGIQTWPNLPLFAALVVWPQREQEVVFEPGSNGVITCNSRDGLQVVIDVSFQYKIQLDKLYNLTIKYKDFETYNKMLISIARANIQHSCGEYTAEDFQRSRNNVAETMSIAIKEDLLSKLDAVVSQTQLRNIDRPVEYDDAVRDKENALNEIRLALAERLQAVTKAETQKEQRVFQGVREVDSAQRDAAVELLRAEAEAAGIIDNYNALAEVYSNVKETHNLTVSGVLTYISNEIFSGAGIETKLAFQSPSQVSYQDEL